MLRSSAVTLCGLASRSRNLAPAKSNMIADGILRVLIGEKCQSTPHLVGEMLSYALINRKWGRSPLADRIVYCLYQRMFELSKGCARFSILKLKAIEKFSALQHLHLVFTRSSETSNPRERIRSMVDIDVGYMDQPIPVYSTASRLLLR